MHNSAESLDCGFVDQAEVRRREAAQVAWEMTLGLGAQAGMAFLFGESGCFSLK